MFSCPDSIRCHKISGSSLRLHTCKVIYNIFLNGAILANCRNSMTMCITYDLKDKIVAS